jgi:hypothetical protein
VVKKASKITPFTCRLTKAYFTATLVSDKVELHDFIMHLLIA